MNTSITLTPSEIIDIIAKNSLIVRCLPYQTINAWSYREGDENKTYIDSEGNPIEAKREVVIQNYDLEHFQKEKQKEKPSKWNRDTAEQRFKNWQKNFPNGRKVLLETKIVKNGGWWLVKEANNTDGTILFNKKTDFFAPTLEEAILLYLDSRK